MRSRLAPLWPATGGIGNRAVIRHAGRHLFPELLVTGDEDSTCINRRRRPEETRVEGEAEKKSKDAERLSLVGSASGVGEKLCFSRFHARGGGGREFSAATRRFAELLSGD